MRLLDLFSGEEGWSQPFRDRGHEVVTLDLDPRFGADHQRDLMSLGGLEQLERTGRFDIVLASPPCDTFSTGSFRHHWLAEGDCPKHGSTTRVGGEVWACGCRTIPKPYSFSPKTEAAKIGWELKNYTMDLIIDYQPRYWIVENPRAMMRNFMAVGIRRTVTWCQYGDTCMKPTDLWGGFPEGFEARACRNGDTCHEAAPRGARTGTQGKKDAAARGKIPYGLALEVCVAAEEGL